jgi:hypothetical protein
VNGATAARAVVVPLFAAGAAVSAASCSGQPAPSGAGEPLVVLGATFVPGDLPGLPPPDGGAPGSGVAPEVTLVESASATFVQGQAGATFSGDVSGDATSVAVRFPNAGTGYWVFAPGGSDPTSPSDLTWSMTFDVADNAPTGLTSLRFAALDADGNGGTQIDQPACVDSLVPDNANACVPSRAPPVLVLSLQWDVPANVDIGLVTPSGVAVTPHHPTTSAATDGGVSADAGGLGVLDRNSDANCVADGLNHEDIVWQSGTPEPGAYLAYADLFSACGQPSVRFTMTLWSQETTDGGFALVKKQQAQGEMFAVEANGGSAPGLYVMSFSLPLSP